MACNLATTLLSACSDGIGKIDNPIELLQLIAELSCELAAAGGGGGGTGASVGTGSPQGVVTGSPGNTYWDITNPGAPQEWVKVTGTSTNTGWVLVLS